MSFCKFKNLYFFELLAGVDLGRSPLVSVSSRPQSSPFMYRFLAWKLIGLGGIQRSRVRVLTTASNFFVILHLTKGDAEVRNYCALSEFWTRIKLRSIKDAEVVLHRKCLAISEFFRTAFYRYDAALCSYRSSPQFLLQTKRFASIQDSLGFSARTKGLTGVILRMQFILFVILRSFQVSKIVGIMRVFSIVVKKTYGFFGTVRLFLKQSSFNKMVTNSLFEKVFSPFANLLVLLFGFSALWNFLEKVDFFSKKCVFLLFPVGGNVVTLSPGK